MEKTKQNTGGVCEKTEARLDTGRALLYNNYYMSNHFAGVAELADAPDLGSGGMSNSTMQKSTMSIESVQILKTDHLYERKVVCFLSFKHICLIINDA